MEFVQAGLCYTALTQFPKVWGTMVGSVKKIDGAQCSWLVMVLSHFNSEDRSYHAEFFCMSGPKLGDFCTLSLVLTTLKAGHIYHDGIINQPNVSDAKPQSLDSARGFPGPGFGESPAGSPRQPASTPRRGRDETYRGFCTLPYLPAGVE